MFPQNENGAFIIFMIIVIVQCSNFFLIKKMSVTISLAHS